MNIAMVSEHASPLATLGGVDAGGQNVHVAALSTALAKQGHAVTVYTRRDDVRARRRVMLTAGVVVEHVDAGPPRPIPKDAIYPHVGTLAARLRRAWELDRPDVVHAHFWMSGIAALEAARPLGIPVVLTFHALGAEKRRHQGAADTSPAARIAEEARIALAADRVIATSSAESFELLRLGAHQRALRVIPCGVDLTLFRPDGPREPRRGNRLRIVTLSRLVPRKGIADVVTALARVPNAELVIAGGGEAPELADDPEAQRLATRARELGVGARVYLRGRVERSAVPALLRSADIVAAVPWYEPFGIVPVEAMACGIPVIASSVGGQVDTVLDGVTGVHVPARDPLRLAEAIDELRTDPVHRRALGAAGAQRAARYDWSRIAAESAEVYRELGAGSQERFALG